MGDDITIGVTEIVNNIEVTAQPNDQIVDISVIDNADEVTLNITPTVIEINVNKGSSYARWGTIYGNLTDQTDLQNALLLKADLVDGKVPAYQLPSFVDDIIEVANYAALPATGETGKIYVTLDNNKIYRWSGSVYIEIAANNAIWGAITGTLSSQTDLVNALNLRVPYTGATSNVNLGEYGLTSGFLGLDTTPTSTPTGIGTIYWDAANRTAALIDGDGDTTLQIGQEQRILVHNNTGSTLTDGQVVYVTGSTGNLPSVSLANASSETTSAATLGVVTESIANGADGFITTSGIVNGLNTLAFNEGDLLWLGTTAGTFTATKPISPNHLVLIGYVIKKAGGNGSILVKIQNTQELEESSDVLFTSLANNQVLTYESATDLWKNKSIATILGYTPANDASVVHLTGNETITGVKTFSVDTIINGVTVGKGGASEVGNTAVGQNALSSNTSGILNTAIGFESLLNNTGGGDNTSLGWWSLKSNTTGNSNVSAGTASLANNTTGFGNTSLGWNSLAVSTTGAFNSALGYLAGSSFGGSDSNANTLTSYSIYIGYKAGPLANSQTNQIVIGKNAIGAGSNTVTIGNTDITTTRLRGEIQGGSFKKDGGTSSQFLKADGSVDSTTYQTALTNPVTGTGTTGYVAFWNGTSTQTGSNDFTFSSGQLNINRAAGNSRLNLQEAGVTIASLEAFTNAARLRNQSTGNVELWTSGVQRFTVFSNGNIAINTTTDAGFRLDVNGTARVQGALTATADSTINGVNIGRGGGTIATNTRVGVSALNSNTTGSGNSAFGISALNANTTGGSNTAIGRAALEANTTGTTNTAVGTFSLLSNISGSNNVSLGFNSGRFIADGTTANTISNTSIFIGVSTKALADNQTNQIVIGHNATGLGSNTTVLGNSSTTTTAIYGNVGIGTTSPSTLLHVYSSTTNAARVRVTGTGTTAGQYRGYEFGNSVGFKGGLLQDESTDLISIFTPIGGQSVNITSGGNVGIGTTSPSAKLDVSAGNINLSNAYYLSSRNNANTANINLIGRNTSDRVIIDADGYGVNIGGGGTILLNSTGGNVGIGTTSPSGLLHLQGNTTNPVTQVIDNLNAGTSAGTRISFRFQGTETGYIYNRFNGGDFNTDIGSSDYMRFLTGGSERMRITSGGNVGIGTTSPSEKLQVNGNILAVGNIYTTDSNVLNLGYNQGGGATLKYNSNGNLDITPRAGYNTIFTTGNVGIGTASPAEKLEVQNGTSGAKIKVSNTGGGYAMLECSSNATSTATLSFTNSLALTGGNVGIGTPSPSYQLQLSTDSAAKPTSALWTIASDERIKENINSYTKGLNELLKINPITYDYNGLGGFKKGKGGVGIIAQEIAEILPDSVSSIKGKLNETDEEEIDILNFNGHELTYILINAVKELKAEIEILKNK